MSRLTDNDKHLGPITYARCSDSWRPLRLVFSTGGGNDDCGDEGNNLTGYAFGWIARVRLPSLMAPWKIWVDTSRYAWAKGPDSGYWDVYPKEYGFSLSDGFLQLFLGPQTHDSLTTKSWCTHLPWTEWHFHRFSLYGLHGEHLKSWISSRKTKRMNADHFTEQHEFEKTMPVRKFMVEDHDGEQIEVTTHIQEREWTFGEKWFQWLRFFRKPRVHRSLDINFAKEVGTEKGSWKGGLCGTSIEMLPGELHEAAFIRYCDQEHRAKYGTYRIKYLGAAKA
jgi:hypothetical protein